MRTLVFISHLEEGCFLMTNWLILHDGRLMLTKRDIEAAKKDIEDDGINSSTIETKDELTEEERVYLDLVEDCSLDISDEEKLNRFKKKYDINVVIDTEV